MIASAALLAVALAAPDDAVQLKLRETAVLDAPGAGAAYAVDGTVAEASLTPGGVLVRGTGVGSTHVAIVSASGEVASRLVVVDPLPPHILVSPLQAGRAHTRLETQYDSASGWLTSGVDVSSHGTRVDLLNLTRMKTVPGDDARSTMARASIATDLGGWKTVLLDSRVEHTPLTLDGTVLRGAHVLAGPLELHAGYTSPLWYRGFLLPGKRESAAGASYRFALSEEQTLAPVAYGFSSPPHQGGSNGGMGSLLYELGRSRDPFHVRAEAGWGGKAGGALLATWVEGEGQLRVEARHLPAGFASLGTGRPHGSSAEASGSYRLSPLLELAGSASGTRQELAVFTERRAGGNLEARWSLDRAWTLTTGAGATEASTGGQRVDTVRVPLGIGWRGEGLSASAQYRWQRNSLLSTGGHGGRLQGAAQLGRFRASAYLDVQQDDATLELVFRDTPELARLLAELGLEARTPEDLERLLRQEPALAAAAHLEGASLELHPWHVVSRADLAWTSGDAARQEVRGSFLLDQTRRTRGLTRGTVATLSYARRLAGSWDVFGAFSSWSRDASSAAQARGWSWSAGFRVTFDGNLRAPWDSTRIEGRVFRDALGQGRYLDGSPPEAGARIRLDGEREVSTDAAGRFAFPDASAGKHRVELVLPQAPGTYFTTPAAVEVEAGEPVAFGLAQAPAHLSGTVRDDAEGGIAGATVTLAGPATRSARTDSSGRFAFAVPDGDYTLAIDPASVPPGYELAGLAPRPVRLDREAPAREEVVIRAFRSISGSLRAANPAGRRVWLRETSESRVVGPDGRYAFRNVAPGRYTLVAETGHGTVERAVEVPEGPAVVAVDLGPAR